MLEPKVKGIVTNAAGHLQLAIKELSKFIIDGEGEVDCHHCNGALRGSFFALISIRDTLEDLASGTYEPEAGFEDEEE